MARNTRILDWMATEASDVGMGAWQNNAFAANILAANTLTAFPLTAVEQVAASTKGFGAFETSSSWMLERIVGSLHFWIDPAETAVYEAYLDIRFLVTPVSSGGAPVLAPSYDLLDPFFTDEQFIHHRTRVFYQTNTWSATVRAIAETNWQPFFDLGVKRKIEENHIVACVIQWVGNATTTVPRLRVTPRLRVLGSQRD